MIGNTLFILRTLTTTLMALCNSLFLLLTLSCFSLISTQETIKTPNYNSLSFPLSVSRRSDDHYKSSSATMLSSSLSIPAKVTKPRSNLMNPYPYKSFFKYSMALIVSLPIGTPPQTQKVVLDTGSQLSWIKCHEKSPPKPPPPSFSSFDPSLSSSFSVLPCTHPLCKPRIPDFTLPTSCDQNRLCHYSYFYADGTLAEGNLVREKITLSSSRRTQTTPPLILGCTRDSSSTEGILGMNLGRLSFASQTKLHKFSYCVPERRSPISATPPGAFYLGYNPNSVRFRYIDLLTPSQGQRMPSFDDLAYTVGVEGVSVGGKRLNISRSVFRADRGGAGQTIIDSGTEYTFLVAGAYSKVREAVAERVVGPKMKKGFVYEGALDLCYDGDVREIGRLVGDLVFEFERGVEITVKKERLFTDVGGGAGCLSIGRSDLLGVESNIIGNFHQQNLWLEFDLVNRRVGFGEADCSRSV